MLKKMKKVCCVAAAIVVSVCSFFGCGKKLPEDEITVYMPDGAPAMAFAKMMLDDTADDGITYRVVNPSVISTEVTNKDMSENADVCALPVIAASKLLGSGENYQMLGVLTSGNLYDLSKNESVIADFASSQLQDLSHLIGKTVGVMQINNVPGMTFKSILNDYGVAWQELTNDTPVAADKVNLKSIVDATQIDPADTSVACYVVAEPAASVKINKNGFTSVCSLTQLYYKGKIPMDCTGPSYIGYPQAVLVAKKSIIVERKAWIEEFLTDVKASGMALTSEIIKGAQIVEAVQAHLEDKDYKTTLNASVLSWETIGRCGVGFVENGLCQGDVIAYLQRILAVNPNATKLPADEFFYFYKY